MTQPVKEKKVTYINTADGRTPVEWWEKEHFHNRTSGVFTADNVEDLLEGRNLIPLSISPVPDDLIICDFCNTRITELPVPVLWGTYAVCPKCFKKVQKGE